MTKAGRRRIKRRYEAHERNIRKMFNVYNDDTESLAGFQVRIKGKDHGVFPNVTQARAALDKARATGEVHPGAGRVTVKVVAESWLTSVKSTKWKPRTAAGYEGIVNNRLGPLHSRAVKDVTPAVVDAFIAGLLREGLRPSTVRHVYHVLNQAMKIAVRDKHIAVNPCTAVDRPSATREKVRIPQMPDVEALLQALSSLDKPKAGEWALYAELAAYAGLRAGEITGLRVGRLDPLRSCLRVEETVYVIGGRTSVGDPKSKAGKRTVPLSQDLSDRLAAHVVGKPRDAYVFGDGETPYRHSNYYRRVFRPAARTVGLDSLRFHDLRHFYASLLLTNPDLNAVDISKTLGHADANLLFNTYGHSFDGATDGLGDWLTAQRAATKPSVPTAKVRKIG
jgi:integrase